MASRFITVSIDIMHDKNLNQSQKFLLAEIEQLTQLDLGCIATNEHFARLIGISKENVSKNLNNLMNKGYIEVKIVKGSRNHQREITLIKIVTPPYQNSNPPLSKRQETKGNILSNKTYNKKLHKFVLEIFPEGMTNDELFINAFLDFEKVRKKKGSVVSERAYKKLFNKLDGLCDKDLDLAIEIIEQSADKGYTDFYALPKGNK